MKKTFLKATKLLSSLLSKKRPLYYSRYYYYETLLSKYNNGLFYSRLLNSLSTLSRIKTDTKIKLFGDKKPNDIDLKDITKKYGKSNYKLVNEDLFEIKVLFYRQKLGKHRAKLEFHFFKNNLFFYTYTFSYLSAKEKEEIIQIIQDKYLEGKQEDVTKKYIVDKNKNIILVNDNVEFSIYYLCDNPIAVKKFLDYVEFVDAKAKNREKWYKRSLYKKL